MFPFASVPLVTTAILLNVSTGTHTNSFPVFSTPVAASVITAPPILSPFI